MNRKRLVLWLVLALLTACGGIPQVTQGIWENSHWDSAIWQ